MPRPDDYLADDDTPRRAAASGGGVPPWVWVLGGAAVFVGLLVGSFVVAFVNRRDALRREHVTRAEARAAVVAVAEPGPGGPRPVVPLALIANSYKTDPAAAAALYGKQTVRVRVVVTATGVRANGREWAGAAVDLGDGPPRGAEPNVLFRLADGPVEVGTTVVIEGRCDGRFPDPRGREMLFFGDCRVVRE